MNFNVWPANDRVALGNAMVQISADVLKSRRKCGKNLNVIRRPNCQLSVCSTVIHITIYTTWIICNDAGYHETYTHLQCITYV